jgi:hypothetical protein
MTASGKRGVEIPREPTSLQSFDVFQDSFQKSGKLVFLGGCHATRTTGFSDELVPVTMPGLLVCAAWRWPLSNPNSFPAHFHSSRLNSQNAFRFHRRLYWLHPNSIWPGAFCKRAFANQFLPDTVFILVGGFNLTPQCIGCRHVRYHDFQYFLWGTNGFFIMRYKGCIIYEWELKMGYDGIKQANNIILGCVWQ